MQNAYKPASIYIITGPASSGKTFLAQTILMGLHQSTNNDSQYISHANFEDDRNTAHITINDNPAGSYMLIDKLHAHQITYKNNAKALVKLINQHKPESLVFAGQDPDGQLVNKLMKQLDLKRFKPRIISIKK